MIELLPALTFIAASFAGGLLMRRSGFRSMGLWGWAWGAAVATSVVQAGLGDSVGAEASAAVLTVLFAALILAGALDESRASMPGGLIPAFAVACLLRGGLIVAGWRQASQFLGLALEPGMELAAAVLIFRSSRRNQAVLAQRLLAPAFACIAVTQAWTAVAAIGLVSAAWLPAVWRTVEISTISIQSIALITGLLRRLGLRGVERRRAEAALHETLGRFRSITEHGFDLFAEVDDDLRLTYISPNLRRYVRRDLAEYIGRPLLDLVDAEDRGGVEAGLRDLAAGKREWHGLARWRLGGGERLWIESSGHAFTTATGERRLLISARDISARMKLAAELRRAQDGLEQRVRDRTAELASTNAALRLEAAERQHAEQALRSSEERYRQTSELTSDYSYEICVLPGEVFEIRWLTGAIERITGYTAQEFAAQNWKKIVHPDDWQKVFERFRRVSEGEVLNLEFRILTKTGELRWLSERLGSGHDPETGHPLLYGAAHDITDAKREESARDELEHGLREKQKLESLGVLAGGIAHDFNNLLTAILGNTAIIYRDLPPDSPLRVRVERIARTAEYATELTGQMLTYAGGGALSMKPLDLSRVVEDMIALLEPQIAKHIELETDFAVGIPPVLGDETQIRQVVMNLVSNGAEAMEPAAGKLYVGTGVMLADAATLAPAYPSGDRPPGRYAYLEVRDIGSGIDPATRRRIFEPFYSTKFSGRGLGLAAVLGVVRGHRGAILVDSSPGHGSRFRVLFRLSEGDDGALAAPPVKSSEAVGPAVLVIDDDEAVREVTQAFLERAGIPVLLAESGRRGLEILERRSAEIGLVIVDFVMPDLDGSEVLREIRLLCAELPVIISTGYTTQTTARTVAEQEFTGFLQKPYDPDLLVLRVRDALAGG